MAKKKDNDEDILLEAKTRFSYCVDWEAVARARFDYDYKFANGDSHNLYQWDSRIVAARLADRSGSKPCLTINKTQQHNLQIINDSKQNKPGVNIRPVGEDASFEAAQIFQEVVRHIEYISNAESVYDHATTFQVEAGIGYWRVTTDYIHDKTFDQEIYIRKIKDPRSVYLDPDITESDGSDARYGFIFDDMPKDLFEAKYPKFKDIVGWSTTFNNVPDTWLTRDKVRVAEYYRKSEREEVLVSFSVIDAQGQPVQINDFYKNLSDEEKAYFKELKQREGNLPDEEKTYQERDVVTNNIEWYKIAGDKIIERSFWAGKYIPIVRLIGTETVIDGILDRKGHTRTLINAQQMYNYNTSANTEFGALQTKAPWIASAEAVEGYEEYYKTANVANHAWMPFNAWSEDGKQLPAPSRPNPPQPSPAYVQGMQIAQNEMMMASGQYQAQMGENENAKSGVAINARQRQGDRATYHFIDNQAIAIRHTGKILIDLIPKIYDTKRVKRISASDGSIMNVTIDPEATMPYQQVQNPNGAQKDKRQEMIEIIFNPSIGVYDVQSEVGPSFATRRQEAFNALTQIAAQNENFMNIAGDILWKVADFPEAQVLAERWRKIIPKEITGDGMDPKIEEAMSLAAQKIEEQLALIAQQTQELKDKAAEIDIRSVEADTARRTAIANAARLDYEAETRRLVALGNAGPIVTPDEIKPVISQLIQGMLRAGEPQDVDEMAGGGGQEPLGEGGQLPLGQSGLPDQAPVPGARQAGDGNWYVDDPDRPGKYLMVGNDGAMEQPAVS